MQSVKKRLTHRTVRGELDAKRGDGAKVVCSEFASHEVIVGFYGASARCDGALSSRSSLERRGLGWRVSRVLCLNVGAEDYDWDGGEGEG